MFIELLHLLLWDGMTPLVPNGKVHGIWTEQGGSSHSSVAVCMSSVKNCWPGVLRGPLPYTVLDSRATWNLALAISACVCTHTCTQIGQTLTNCAAPWSCTECARMIHWQSAFSCTKKLSGMTKYDSGTSILCCTLEEYELECLCTCCNELLLFVLSSGGISEEIPVWNG